MQRNNLHPLSRFIDHVNNTPDTPEATAIIDHFNGSPKKIWTYQEINEASNQLASELINLELKKGDRIGASFDAGPWYYVALLAIWKVGMVYAPLPTNPSESIERMKKINADALLVDDPVFEMLTNEGKVTEKKAVSEQYQVENRRCINLTTLYKRRITSPFDEVKLEPVDLKKDAYINCSSGTTSAPKVIINTLEGIEGRVQGVTDRLIITKESALLGYVAPVFDAHLLDALLTLCNGAVIYLVPTNVRETHLEKLIELFTKAEEEYKRPITHAVLLPTVLSTLNQFPSKPFTTLESVITMGEKCYATILRRWLSLSNKKGKPIVFWNGYGPTEATIATTLTYIPAEGEIKEFDMKHALPGANLYLALDQKESKQEIIPLDCSKIPNPTLFSPTEPYIEGELYIGGLGIGRYDDPALDKKKYITLDADLLSSSFPNERENGRIYRTGDKIRLTLKGEVIFQARIDGGAKINGKFTSIESIAKAIHGKLNLLPEEHFKLGINSDQIIACVRQGLCDETSILSFLKNQPSDLRPHFFFLVSKFHDRTGSNKREFDLEKTLFEEKNASLVCRSFKNQPLQNTDMESDIAKIWQTILFNDNSIVNSFLKSNPFTPESRFDEWGGNSLTTIQMIGHVWNELIKENKEETTVPYSFIEHVIREPSIARITSYIRCYKTLHAENLGTNKADFPVFFLRSRNTVKKKRRLSAISPLVILTMDEKQSDFNIIDKALLDALVTNIRSYQKQGPYHLLPDSEKPTALLYKIASRVGKILESQGESVYISLFKKNIRSRCSQIRIKQIHDILQKKLTWWYRQHEAHVFSTVSHSAAESILSRANVGTLWIEAPLGTGKTATLHAIYQQLWQQYLKSPENKPIPFYLNLEGQTALDCLDTSLTKAGINEQEKKILFKNGIIFLCDHFERLARYDFPDFLHMSSFNNTNNSKVIIATTYCNLEQALIASNWQPHTYKIVRPHVPESSLFDKLTLEGNLKAFYNIALKNNAHWISRRPDLSSYKNFLHYAMSLCLKNKVNQFCIKHTVPEFNDTTVSMSDNWANPYFKLFALLFKSITINNYNTVGTISQNLFDYFYKQHAQELKYSDETPEKKQDILDNLPKSQNLKKLADDFLGNIGEINLGNGQDGYYPIFIFYPLTGDYPEHYIKLTSNLNRAQPFCAFQMDAKNLPRESKMLDKAKYFSGLINSYHTGPCILLGWSFGGLLAFNVAELLQEAGKSIPLVIIIDCPPPKYLNNASAENRSKMIIKKLADDIYHVNEVTLFAKTLLDTNPGKELKSIDQDNVIFEQVLNAMGKSAGLALHEQQQTALTSLIKDAFLFEDFSKKDMVIIDNILAYLNSTSRDSFIVAMKNSQINLKAYYEFATSDHIKLHSQLFIAEAASKTAGLNQEANYLDWGNYTNKPLILKEFGGDHFTLFNNSNFLSCLYRTINDIQPKVIQSLEKRINDYIMHLKNTTIKVSFYITPNISTNQNFFMESKISEEKQNTQSLLKKFISNSNHNKKIMLIMGEAGIGKTTMVKKMAIDIIELKWIPIFVKTLHGVYQGILNALRENLKINEYELANEKQQQKPFLFIFDHNEALSCLPEIKLILKKWPACRAILTARNYFLSSDNEIDTILLSPFNENQIFHYFSHYYPGQEEIGIKTVKHLGLEKLIINPLTLSIVTNILFHLDKKNQSPTWTLTKIYSEILSFYGKEVVSSIIKEEGVLPGINLIKLSHEYAALLAYTMTNRCVTTDDSFFSSQDLLIAQARQACERFLRYEEGQIVFIHQMYEDYFLACYLYNHFSEANIERWIKDNKLNPRYQYTFSFLSGIISIKKPNLLRTFISELLLLDTCDLVGNYSSKLLKSCLAESENFAINDYYSTFLRNHIPFILQKISDPRLQFLQKQFLTLQKFNVGSVNEIKMPFPTITKKETEKLLSNKLVPVVTDLMQNLIVKFNKENMDPKILSPIALEIACDYIIQFFDFLNKSTNFIPAYDIEVLVENFKKRMLQYLDPGSVVDDFLNRPFMGALTIRSGLQNIPLIMTLLNLNSTTLQSNLKNIIQQVVFEKEERLIRSFGSFWDESIGSSIQHPPYIVTEALLNAAKEILTVTSQASILENAFKKTPTSYEHKSSNDQEANLQETFIIFITIEKHVKNEEGDKVGNLLHRLNSFYITDLINSFNSSLSRYITLPFLSKFFHHALINPKLPKVNKWMVIDYLITSELLNDKLLDPAIRSQIILTIIQFINEANEADHFEEKNYFPKIRFTTSCIEVLGQLQESNIDILNTLLKQLHLDTNHTTLVSYHALNQYWSKQSKISLFKSKDINPGAFCIYLELLSLNENPVWIKDTNLYCCLEQKIFSLQVSANMLATIKNYFAKKYAFAPPRPLSPRPSLASSFSFLRGLNESFLVENKHSEKKRDFSGPVIRRPPR